MKYTCLLWLIIGLSGCASVPDNSDDICAIFKEKRSWYKAAIKAEKKWGAPLSVPMAILYQESGFRAKARPPMRYALGFIPYGRASSAYGYSQAKTVAWKEYQREGGSRFADRDDFGDAMDFVQWYVDKTKRANGVSKWDAYNQYLNYHEGRGGYARGSYKNKKWLLNVANKVSRRADRYAQQYRGCKKSLSRSWFKFW